MRFGRKGWRRLAAGRNRQWWIQLGKEEFDKIVREKATPTFMLGHKPSIVLALSAHYRDNGAFR
jgi:hypothetical protein